MIRTRAVRPQSIELYGTIGTFQVPNSPIRTVHFSTFANGRERWSHERALLSELKPMRERIESSELRDLDALLQRDLNDARVAQELVPYLKGQTGSGIAFFPAVLAALIPKGFIEGDGGTYPAPETGTTDAGEPFRDYGAWRVQQYLGEDGAALPLGRLTLYPTDANVIVLDGQHRASAFRFASGEFGKDKEVYSAFYEGVEVPEQFEADLPVTLIWFESDEGTVEPTFVSRNLFVDVNTTAKAVSRSRNILLDDRHVDALVTRFFLSEVAETAGFAPGTFSLLHSGFDLDTDLADGDGHPLTLTNPQIVETVASWMMLGSRGYNTVSKTAVQRSMSRDNMGEFEEIFPGPQFSAERVLRLTDGRGVVLIDHGDIPPFREAYKGAIHPVLNGLFNDFVLLGAHYVACTEVAEWQAGANTTIRRVWSDVFTGGEGLYYSLRYQARKGAGPQLDELIQGIGEVEAEFSKRRAAHFADVSGSPEAHVRRIDRVFESFRTKAFQVALVMALDEWKKDDSFSEAYDGYRDRLNARSADDWAYLLFEVKGELLKGVDPKKWPTYQNLIYRVIEDEGQFYNEANFLHSPDGLIFAKRVERAADAWTETEDVQKPVDMEDIPPHLIRSWGQDAKSYVDGLMAKANLRPLDADPVSQARGVVAAFVKGFNEGK